MAVKRRIGRQEALQQLGWREWLALPDLGIEAIKAKVDTGARSSALHAFFVEPYRERGREMVRFGVHPSQTHNDVEKICTAQVIDQRMVADSGGHREKRFVILTSIAIYGIQIEAEVTLTNRDSMRFRMLLGRTALARRFVVDPDRSYLAGKIKK